MKNLLKDLDLKIVIISRGRYDSITTHELVPDFIEVVVPNSEVELYKEAIPNPVIGIDDDIIGLGKLRNHIMDKFEENTVIMLDDDLLYVYNLENPKAVRHDNPETVLWILINASVMANDLGVGVFGFSQVDIRKYSSAEPFKLTGWVGGVIGVIGKDIRFRNDKFKVDIDFCLKNLYEHRILWIDNRYYFAQRRDNNKGGNSAFRTKADFDDSVNKLKRKWGKYLKVSENKSQISIAINVSRKQPIVL